MAFMPVAEGAARRVRLAAVGGKVVLAAALVTSLVGGLLGASEGPERPVVVLALTFAPFGTAVFLMVAMLLVDVARACSGDASGAD
jgi:hypothetical protein